MGREMVVVDKDRVDKELNALFTMVDISKDDKISRDEFQILANGATWKKARKEMGDERMENLFSRVDADNSGYVSREEWTQFFGSERNLTTQNGSKKQGMYTLSDEEFDAELRLLKWVCKVCGAAVSADKEYADKVMAKKKYVNDELKKIFWHLDSDDNGEIDKREFKVLLNVEEGEAKVKKLLDNQRLKQSFKSADSGGSDTVDEGEFLNYFGNQFYGGLYHMKKAEVDQYIDFFKALATMETGVTPEEVQDGMLQEAMQASGKEPIHPATRKAGC